MLSHLLPVIHLQVSVSTFQCSSREENSPKISALTTCVPHRSRWWLHGDPIPLSGPAERRSFDWPGSRGPIEGFSWGNVKICWFPIRAVTSPLLTGMHFFWHHRLFLLVIRCFLTISIPGILHMLLNLCTPLFNTFILPYPIPFILFGYHLSSQLCTVLRSTT